MKKLTLLFTILFLFFITGFSQDNYWVSTQLPGQYTPYHHQALGETCILYANDTSQAVHAFDINQGEWQTLLVPTQLAWTNVAADGNVALIFNDSVVAAYSATTSSFSAIFYSGDQSSLNMIPYGCIDNFAWFLTDQYFYVFDAGDGQWHAFTYTPPGDTPWGGGINGKGDYIYMSLWASGNSTQYTLAAYSLQTKTFTEFTESNIGSFQLLDHGFTFISNINADPYFCGGYSAFTGQVTTKTHTRSIQENDPGVWPEIVTPLICELFTANEQISGNNWRYYMWVYNTVVGDFAEYIFDYIYSGSQYHPVASKCGGQTAAVMIHNGEQDDIIECLVYSAPTNSFRLFNTPLYNWGSMSFSAGGLFIDGYDANNYFLYDVETQETYTQPVQWTESIQPGVKGRGLGNDWAVFAYTEQYEDTTHVFSYTRDDAALTPFPIPLRASTSNYRGKDLFGLLMTDQGPVVSVWVFAPQHNLWTEKDLASASYFGSEGNYMYINYPDQNQTWFYDALANQEYWFTSAQQQAHVLARDSVFLMYSGRGEYTGYSLIKQNSSTYDVSRYPGQQWNNFVALMIHNDEYEFLVYDGYNNIFAPLLLTEMEGPARRSWPAGKTALVATENGYLFAYYPGDITSTRDWDDDSAAENTSDFIVFPNPVKEKIYFKSDSFKQKSAIVSIYDLNGRKLLEKQIILNEKSSAVDISKLSNGIYFCHLISENKSSTQKLIIQK